MALRAAITAEGNSDSDLLDALHEAVRRIEQGNTSGFDRNESGNFNFEITERNSDT